LPSWDGGHEEPSCCAGTPSLVSRITGKSHVAIGRALQQLEHAGIINRLNERKWGRVWECDALLSLVDRFDKGAGTGGPA
jgi:hypothetical protein